MQEKHGRPLSVYFNKKKGLFFFSIPKPSDKIERVTGTSAGEGIDVCQSGFPS